MEPASPASAGGFFTTGPPGKPTLMILDYSGSRFCITRKKFLKKVVSGRIKVKSESHSVVSTLCDRME